MRRLLCFSILITFNTSFVAAATRSDVPTTNDVAVSARKADKVNVESASERAKLPHYKVISAADDSALTVAFSHDYIADNSWARSNADEANRRYSSLKQVSRDNVRNLKLAWTYRSGDGEGNIQANPVIVDGVIFAPTVGRSIVAINGATGTEIWRFRPPLLTATRTFYDPTQKAIVQLRAEEAGTRGLVDIGFGPATRGLTYWAGDAQHGPQLFFMSNGYLIALDPNTGKMVETFGANGAVASTKGAGSSSFLGAVAPAIYRNVIVAPNQNIIEAFDVITGSRLWQFNTLQYPVQRPDDDNGGNVWGGIAMDTDRGIAFIAAGDPHPNFVGIDRPGADKHTSSVIALDALTGRLLWSFQEIAHDLWDLDLASPPNLVTIKRNGKRVDAVAQVTKLGNTLLLDRLSGKPLFPYRLRRAPTSRIPAEHTWPYQPDLLLPQPFARQTFTNDDVTDITPESRASVMDRIRNATLGWFEPPRDDKPIVFYGVHGGAEWTGASFDPTTGWLYVSANEIAWIQSLSRMVSARVRSSNTQATSGEALYLQRCSICHGDQRQGKGMAPALVGVVSTLSRSQVLDIITHGRNSMPPIVITEDSAGELLNFLFEGDIANVEAGRTSQADLQSVSYQASDFTRLLDSNGYPGSRPPWGTLNAIDLNTGKIVWKVPLGEYEELTTKGIPKTGTENFGGAMVTAGGLVFCAGTRDLKIRAFDKETGAELWQYKLPYGGYAPPATYEANGRQYIVIAATGGGKLGGARGDTYVAFALPDQH